ncbi:MAG: putative methylase [Steroidobacteraceae bacterium]|nr:putative methylase [Steroidobacteraceae bacterium]
MVPSAVTFTCCAVEAATWYHRHIECWTTLRSDYSFSAGRTVAVNTVWDATVNPEFLLAPPANLPTISLSTLPESRFSSHASFPVERAGTVHGIAAWFKATLVEGVEITNSPLDASRIAWDHALFPIDQPVEVAPGNRIDVLLRLDTLTRGAVWTWQVQVVDEAGTRLSDSRHSTFHSLLIDRDGLKRQSPDFAPRLSDRGHIAATIARLIGEGSGLEEAAAEIARQFPSLMPSGRQAEMFAMRVAAESAAALGSPRPPLSKAEAAAAHAREQGNA